jgi:hypothetical protein
MFVISTIHYTDMIYNIAQYTVYAMSTVAGLVVLAFYMKLIAKTTGIVKKEFIFSLLGICIMFLGVIFDSSMITSLLSIPIFLPPIITCIGMIIFSFSQRKEK